MGATCAESPVPSVASEELAAGKRWTSLALVMQVIMMMKMVMVVVMVVYSTSLALVIQVGIGFPLGIITHMLLKFSLE